MMFHFTNKKYLAPVQEKIVGYYRDRPVYKCIIISHVVFKL